MLDGLVAAVGLGELVGLLAQDLVAAQPRRRLLHRRARRRRLRLHAIGTLALARRRGRRRRHARRRLRHGHRRRRRGRRRVAARRRRRRRLALRRRFLVTRRRLLRDGVGTDLLRRRRLRVAVRLRRAAATDRTRHPRRCRACCRPRRSRSSAWRARRGPWRRSRRCQVVERVALARALAVDGDALHARRRRFLLRRLRHGRRHPRRRRPRRRRRARRRRVMRRRPLDGHRPTRRLERDLGLVARRARLFARRVRHRAAALGPLQQAVERGRVLLLLALRARHVEFLVGDLAVLEPRAAFSALELRFLGRRRRRRRRRLIRHRVLRRRHRHLAARPVDRDRSADEREHRRRRQRRVLHHLARERQQHAAPRLALRRRMHELRVQRAAAERRRRLHRRHHALDRRAHPPERLHLLPGSARNSAGALRTCASARRRARRTRSRAPARTLGLVFVVVSLITAQPWPGRDTPRALRAASRARSASATSPYFPGNRPRSRSR